ncbi:hypothetical protein BDW59DRAFT_148430 [Aspergillus cavernicola]|uniref:SWR1-complex protein 3 domain-containing protein n=1 Tax=Aspergillus cavernicola TaxID=176166 RepID=A0ABR4I9W6_9EURO
MAEKRRLSARERREPAAKRRVSEAAPRASSPAQSQQAKRKASTPAVAASPAPTPNPPPETVEPPLPTKIKDADAIPILPSAQPACLSPKEYQSIAESAVLLASLERSKKKWLSDGILERYWTKPKKTKREQLEGKNPPKESMSKVGSCNIVVGPHLFDAVLYTVKDPNAPPPVQYTPTQRPMVHYGHPNNFQQYHPYPHTPAQNQRPPPPQASHGTPPAQQGYPQANRPPPPQPARTPNNQTPQRPSGPQSTQRPTSNQNPPTQPPKPNPDPVIQMLATRAAQDPELKALMRLVASTNATQEQLRTFQAHIDELNAIIRAREQQQRRQQQQQPQQPQQAFQPPTPSPAQPSPRPSQPKAQAPPQPPTQRPPQPPPATPQQQPPQPDQQTPAPQSLPQKSQQSPQSGARIEVQVPKPPQPASTPQNSSADPLNRQLSASQTTPTTPQVKQEPGVGTTGQAPVPRVLSPSVAHSSQQSPAVQTMPPPPQQQQVMGQKPGPQYPPHQQPPFQGQPPAIQSRPPQYSSPAPYYRATPPRPPPPRLNYKSVVLEFTSPLTPYGSSTSGHAGSGDRYLFPENTILEWLAGGTTVLASFLLLRKVDPSTPFPIETAPDIVPSRAKGKSASKSKKAEKNKDKSATAQKEKSVAKEEGAAAKTGATNPQSSENMKSPDIDSNQGPPAQGDQKTQQDPDLTKPASDTQQGKDKVGNDKKASNLKEYYQPITFRIYSTNPKILEPLARVVKPADEVRKYMNEIMDRVERAPEGFIAYQLPREHAVDEHEPENDKKNGTGTPVPGSLVNGRSKLSRGRNVGEESDADINDMIAKEEEEEEEEELKDFYGAPTGLMPVGI